MAIGDAAAAAGLTTYTSAQAVSLGFQNDNQNADYIAADRARLTALEGVALGVPKFGVQRSTNGQTVGANTWSQMTAGAWRTPDKNTGFTSWAGGVLTVARSGVYTLAGHVEFYNDDYTTVAVQVTKNTTTVDTTTGTVFKVEHQWSNPSVGMAQSAEGVNLMVPLAAGDALRFFVLQRNLNNNSWNTGPGPFDLTWQVLFVDNL